MAGGECQHKQDTHRETVSLLKRNLEGWREVLLPINSLMMWERSYHPGILLGASTIVFSLLWYFEPSVLTTFSVLGIIVCIVDYLVPTLSANFFASNKWTGIHEREFEEICRGLANTCIHIQNCCSFMNYLKEAKPKIYFMVVLSLLTLLAWIGNLMNNLLLTYILGKYTFGSFGLLLSIAFAFLYDKFRNMEITINKNLNSECNVSVLLLVPGMKHHGILWKYFEQAIQAMCKLLGGTKMKKM